MYKTIDKYDFVQAFDDYNRGDNFSAEAREALFDYFESYEEDTGEQVELDVIEICCEWSEYDSLEELVDEYMDGYEEEMKYRLPDIFDEEDEDNLEPLDKDTLSLSEWPREEIEAAEEELSEDAIKFLEDRTTIIELSGGYLLNNF